MPERVPSYAEKLEDRLDEARRIARALYREESLLPEDAPTWLTEDGPEDIAARERRIEADHRMMRDLFRHLPDPDQS